MLTLYPPKGRDSDLKSLARGHRLGRPDSVYGRGNLAVDEGRHARGVLLDNVGSLRSHLSQAL